MNWKQKIIQFIKRDDRKAIFFINVTGELDKIANFFKGLIKNIQASHLVVFFNLEIPNQFAQMNLRTDLSENYLSKEDYESIDKYVCEGLSKSWYLHNDVTNYRGLPLGKMFEYDFQKYLIPRIKNLEIIRKIDEKENIQKIIIMEDSGELGEVAKSYGRINNIPILEIFFSRNRKLFFLSGLRVRTKFTDFLTGLLDYLAFKKVIKFKDKKGLILIDAKLSKSLKLREDEICFLQSPLEKGIKIRFDLIRGGSAYLPIYLKENRRYAREWNEYKKRWKRMYYEKEFRAIFEYKDISIWEMVCNKLSTFFLKSIPRIVSNINLLDEVFKRKNIKITVLRNDVKELEKTIVFSARLAKVPSLVIQHGILAETNGHNVLLADKYAAWGKTSVEWYGRFGNSREKFEITGNPRFDILPNRRPQLSRQALCKRLNLDENKGIILFAPQQINKFSSFWTDDLFWVMTDKLLKALQHFPDKQLIIKVDPYEDSGPYEERIIKGLYNNAAAVKDIDIYTLIIFSEVVITLDSTVGLEAMVFDKPLITVNLTKRQDRVPYAEKGGALGVYNGADLHLAIKQALTDRETISRLKIGRNRFLREYAHAIDGKATERILNIFKCYVGGR